jgi:predicted amidohydrolase YtcJ
MNREAMALFGIVRGVERVPFGRVRFDQRGEPTGFVTDFAVMGISRRGQEALERVLPGYAREQQYASTLENLDMAAEFSDAGAELAFSSDWDVAEMDPLIGIYTALTRADLDGGAAWVPEETVDLATALRAYTLGGARTVFAEGDRGVLREGAAADLALLSQDPFAFARTEPRRLLDTRVELIVVDGVIVHRA